jgi:t-SNARE complex subunit (syntaxin)
MNTVDVEEETNQAKDHTEAALENARQADMRRGFCQCSKTKLICWGLLVLIAVVVVLTLVLSLKK